MAGLTLSLFHQASLGATYSVLAGRGIWFNQSAPVQFVFSAISGGIALLFVSSVFVFRVMRPRQVSDEALFDLAHIAGGITLLLTYLRVWDWAVTNACGDGEMILDLLQPDSLLQDARAKSRYSSS